MLSAVDDMSCCGQLLAWMDSRQKTDVHSITHLSLWVPPGDPIPQGYKGFGGDGSSWIPSVYFPLALLVQVRGRAIQFLC